jgi:hypothetical protein
VSGCSRYLARTITERQPCALAHPTIGMKWELEQIKALVIHHPRAASAPAAGDRLLREETPLEPANPARHKVARIPARDLGCVGSLLTMDQSWRRQIFLRLLPG